MLNQRSTHLKFEQYKKACGKKWNIFSPIRGNFGTLEIRIEIKKGRMILRSRFCKKLAYHFSTCCAVIFKRRVSSISRISNVTHTKKSCTKKILVLSVTLLSIAQRNFSPRKLRPTHECMSQAFPGEFFLSSVPFSIDDTRFKPGQE